MQIIDKNLIQTESSMYILLKQNRNVIKKI